MPVRLAALPQGSVLAAAALVVAALTLIYLPDIGHGFLRDDFRWVRAAKVDGLADLRRIATENVGFYRPIVTASFAVNRALFGLRPFPYALTNFALLLVGMWVMVRLGPAIGLAPPFALTAAAMWALNFHGVNMAVLWISGRTALLLCVFSLAALASWLRGHSWRAGAWCLLALLSKEEAVVLPVVFIIWRWYSSDDRTWAVAIETIRKALPMVAALAIYLALRAWSGAFGPLNAPDYYQFTFAPVSVARNAAEYADRSCTIVVVILLLTLAVARRRPMVAIREQRTVLLLALWLVTGFALTVFLPVRSSLYALFPAIGSCLAGSILLQGFYRVSPERTRGVLLALLVLAFTVVPLYWSRNVRWVEPADLSRQLVADLQQIGPTLPDGTRLAAVDDQSAGLRSVFDGLFADAVTLYVGRDVTGELVESAIPAPADAGVLRLSLRGERLVVERSPPP